MPCFQVLGLSWIPPLFAPKTHFFSKSTDRRINILCDLCEFGIPFLEKKFDVLFPSPWFVLDPAPFCTTKHVFFEIGGSSHTYFSFRSISHTKRKVRKEGESIEEKASR